MRRRYDRAPGMWAALAASGSILFACESRPAGGAAVAAADAEVRAVTQTVDQVQIDAVLVGGPGPYLHQETVVLAVTFRNTGTGPRPVPYLVAHSLVFELRLPDGIIRRGERPFKPAGPLRNQPEPDVTLAAGDSVTYRLPLALGLGLVPPGRHQVRLTVAGPPLGFETGWLDLAVAEPVIAAARNAPSSTGAAQALRVIWRDDGLGTPYMLTQSRELQARPLLVETRRAGVAAPGSEPAIGIGPAGVDPDAAWFAWATDGRLALTRLLGQAATSSAVDLPPGDWQAVHPFAAAERPDGTGTAVMVLLSDDASGRLTTVAGNGETWNVTAGTTLDGRLQAITAVPLAPMRLVAVTARAEGQGSLVEARIFGPDGVSGPVSLVRMEGAVEQLAAAASAASEIAWAAVRRGTGGGSLIVTSGRLDGQTGRPARDPRERTLTVPAAGWVATAGIDDRGRTWVMLAELGRVTVFAPGSEAGVEVPVPAGFRQASLSFRRGELPQILGLDPAAGFVTIPVPGAGRGGAAEPDGP